MLSCHSAAKEDASLLAARIVRKDTKPHRNETYVKVEGISYVLRNLDTNDYFLADDFCFDLYYFCGGTKFVCQVSYEAAV